MYIYFCIDQSTFLGTVSPTCRRQQKLDNRLGFQVWDLSFEVWGMGIGVEVQGGVQYLAYRERERE
jgi:hypothetical protein